MSLVRFRFWAPYMREWLSGRASPCQGEGREFESRLALFFFKEEQIIKKVLTIRKKSDKIHLVEKNMREWLSGRASPCQGEGREFESRLALLFRQNFIKCASGSVVEHRLAKARVASSNLVSRLKESVLKSSRPIFLHTRRKADERLWQIGLRAGQGDKGISSRVCAANT